MYSKKFDYVDFGTKTINGKRYYDCSGKFYPSITSILGSTLAQEKIQILENWKKGIGEKEAERQTLDAGNRGTNVHEAIEYFLINRKAPSNLEKRDLGLFNSIKWLLSDIDEVYGLEIPLYSNVLKIAGRTDCIGVYAGKESIIDFKTSTKQKDEERISDYWLQCTFYALAHNEMYGTEIRNGAIIMAVENGLPQVWSRDLYQYIPQLLERIDTFYMTETI